MKILEVAIIIVRRIESDLLFVKSCCGWCLPADCLRVVERKGGAEKKIKSWFLSWMHIGVPLVRACRLLHSSYPT